MVLAWLQMFNSAGESTTLAGMNAGTTATVGAYRPPYAGRLLKVQIWIGSEAATSLVEDVRVEMTCTEFKPNTIHFVGNGSGLRTATTPQHFPAEFNVDQPVKTEVDINANYIHDSGSPVTSRIRVMGLFQF